jgi:hypothetical protein
MVKGWCILMLAGFGVFFCTVNRAKSATIRVPADQPTIQAGIDAARDGDVVIVSRGKYVENINFNGKAITVASFSGPKATIIDGGNVAPVVSFVSGEKQNSAIQGFTLKNGLGSVPPLNASGGGVSVYYSSPSIVGNIITNNSTPQAGGGIGVIFGSPVIDANTITHNSSGFGAGISINEDSAAIISYNTIAQNSALGFGGGVYLFSAGTPTFKNNIIKGNDGGLQGGGVYDVNEAGATFVQNVITDNYVLLAGGGVYVSVPLASPSGSFVNNTIVNNNGQGMGSAVYAVGFDSTLAFINNLLVAQPREYAVYCDSTYDLNPPVFQNNDIFTPRGTELQGSCVGETGTNGNISVNPQFQNVRQKIYQPTSGSPTIDAGTNGAPNLPGTDILNNPRIVDGNADGTATVDIGAYELQ